MGDRRHWMCTKTLFKTAVSSPFILYTESLRKSGLERLDDRRDMITQSLFRQINDPKHPLHYLLPPVKVSHSQMVLRPTYPYQIPLAKLYVMEGTLYHNASPISFSSAA